VWLRLENAVVPTKLVYTLAEDLKADPETVALTQAVTQDKSKPFAGLKGTWGLYGSPPWRENIEKGRMPLLRVSGVIKDTHVAGQDETEVNTVSLELADGSIHYEEMYVNDVGDKSLYRIGSRVEIVYGRDELKQPAPDGGVNYLDIPLVVAVSLRPIQ
jgi:hypothetical protein